MTLILLIFFLFFPSGGDRLTLGTKPEDSSVSFMGVPYILTSYIGRFHNYPKSGEDVVKYCKTLDSLCAVHKDSVMLAFSNMVAPFEITESVLCDKRNSYRRNKCIIRSDRFYKKIKIIGSLSDWQKQSYDLFIQRMTPACYDEKGIYIWILDNQSDTIVNMAFKKVMEKYRYTICFLATHFDGRSSYVPYRVHVCYSKKAGLKVIKESSRPKTMVLRSQIAGQNNIKQFFYEPIPKKIELLSKQYLMELEQTLEKIISADERIDVIDCFVPICSI